MDHNIEGMTTILYNVLLERFWLDNRKQNQQKGTKNTRDKAIPCSCYPERSERAYEIE